MLLNLTQKRINYLAEFNDVIYSKETNLDIINTISLVSIKIFLSRLELDKNYVCSIEFIPSISNYNSRFHRNICDPFLINIYSTPALITDLILQKTFNKYSVNSRIIINY